MLWVFCFTVYVSFTYFAVMNVVTGVFCNSAIEAARREPDLLLQNIKQEQQWYTSNLTKLFQCLDRLGSGRISLTDLQTCLKEEQVISLFQSMDLEVDDAWMLFRLLDMEQKGDVAVEEFIKSCMHLRGTARNYDLIQLKYENRRMMKKLGEIAGKISHDQHRYHVEWRTFELNLLATINSSQTSREIVSDSTPRQAPRSIYAKQL